MSDTVLMHSLKRPKIFKGLYDEDLKMVSTLGSIEKFDTNSILINEGQTGTALYIIIRGHVEIFLPKKSDYKNKKRLTKIELGRLTQGDCFGEYSVIDNSPTSASVITLEECDLFIIPKINFERIINSDNRLAMIIYKNMLQILIKRARDYDKELDFCDIL